MGVKRKWIVWSADGEDGGVMAAVRSVGIWGRDLRWRDVWREWGTIMCLSGVEAEVVCTVGCQGVLGGFHLWAVGSCRRLLVDLQRESATSAVWAPSVAVIAASEQHETP